MSGHRYISSTNPFDEDDDVDDETFLKNSSRNNYSYSGGGASKPQSFDDHIQTLQERRKDIESRTLQSTERSINILRDSEQIGIATGEELMRQREQLERTDKRLDEINQSLRFSQKHINGIKSVFSSLKNYMSGRNNVTATAATATAATTTTGSSTGTTSPSASTHSSSNNTVQSQIVRPEFREAVSSAAQKDNYDAYDNHPLTRMKNQDEYIPPSQQMASSGSKDITAKLDANLQEMCTSISRLKGLATDLQFEIDTQNDLIGDITVKTDKADLAITKQNKDMNRLLKK